MAAPLPLNHKATLRRPIGAVTSVFADVPCRLVPSLRQGRGGFESTTYLTWSHYVDFDVSTDSIKVMDGTTRPAGFSELSFFEGDQLDVSLQRGNALVKLAVVWVEWRFIGEDREYIRVYCTRDSRSWTTL